MQRALELAAYGTGSVAPNPLVGCVLVHDGKIIGEGWHRNYGEAHAEVNAVNAVADRSHLPYSTLYVTLEPCNHTGKTPPCTDLIIQSQIPKVIVATGDPNPRVAGTGIKRLKDAGIEVIEGVMKQEAAFQNRRFITFHTKKRPYIILKWAETSDRFMDRIRTENDTGSFQISGPQSARTLHRWRTEEASILVGAQTAINDNPKLNARLWPGKNPVRILIDPNLKTPGTFHLLDNSVRTLVFNRLLTKTVFQTEFIQLDFSREILPDLLAFLHHEQLQSVLVEGGAGTLSHFLDAGLWDELRIFRSSTYLTSGVKSPELPAISFNHQQSGTDLLITGFNTPD